MVVSWVLRWVRRTSTRQFSFSSDADAPPKLLVVQPRLHPPALLNARLMEALRLADSLQQSQGVSAKGSLPHFVLAHRSQRNKRSSRIHAGAYFGAGTIDTVRVHVDAMDAETGVDAVFVNAPLSGAQQRNLESAWKKPVLDRVGLIIEIFGTRARTKEAKLQVELAALDYKKSRLVRAMGKGGRLGFGAGGEEQVVSARGRASAGRGFISGSGETEIQLQRRRIAERKNRLQVMLSKVRQTRSLHRSNREGIPVVAVVGYTNAGKSTLVGALSRSTLYADDRLFATLDTQLRSVYLPSGRKVLLSDTVGFISDLPIQLVEAFHATLEEVVEADILLHVMDSSAPDREEQRAAVLQVLKEIGVSQEALDQNMIEVLNKVDIEQEEATEIALPESSHNLEDTEEAPADCEDEDSEEVPADSEDDEDLEEAPASCKDVSQEIEAPASCKDVSQEIEAPVAAASDKPGIWGTQLLDNKVNRVPTSATQGIGLDNLLHIIDTKLKIK